MFLILIGYGLLHLMLFHVVPSGNLWAIGGALFEARGKMGGLSSLSFQKMTWDMFKNILK